MSSPGARSWPHGGLARFRQAFFPWYNTEHRHSGIGLLTPYEVHHGLADQRIADRAQVLASAYAAHPERFVGGLPQPAEHGGAWRRRLHYRRDRLWGTLAGLATR
jgi:hypothetical protein